MTDFFDRQAVIDLFETYQPRMATSVIEFVNALKGLPTVKAEPVRHGKWIYGEHEIAMCDGYRCSKCGYFVPWDYGHKSIDYINEYHYCPSCGAKMDLEVEGRPSYCGEDSDCNDGKCPYFTEGGCLYEEVNQ